MTGSTISTTITHGITLGSGGFASPLTITTSGAVLAQQGADGITASLASGAIYNLGVITGGSAGTDAAQGGAGVDLQAGVTLSNNGVVTGGAGGATKGDGGAGVVLTGGLLANYGMVAGGDSPDHAGYVAGGAGVRGTGTVVNIGTIHGGDAFYKNAYGRGGDGVFITGTVTNSGLIQGGGDGPHEMSLYGGDGVDLAGPGFLSNAGTIIGGNGLLPGYGAAMFGRDTVVNFGVISGGGGGKGIEFLDGGVLVNSGTIIGGLLSSGQHADAVYFVQPTTLIVQAGSEFIGDVVADARAGNTLQATGNVTLTGIGAHYTGFETIRFDSGYAQGGYGTIVGGVAGLASGVSVTGFIAGDDEVLAGFSASGAALNAAGVELVSGGVSLSLNLKGSGALNVEIAAGTIASGGGVETQIEALHFGGGLFAGEIELVGAGGTADGPYLNAGGRATIYAGGTVTDAHIAGGLLDVEAGAHIVDPVYFYGAGTLELGGTVGPANQIFEFGAGETIELSSLPFEPGGTASVVARDHVVIRDDGQIFKLHLYGYEVGDKLNLSAGADGAVLTVGTAAMGFLAPETAAAAAARENWFGGSVMAETPVAVPLFVSSAVHFGAVPDLVETVHKGGVQGFVVLREA